MLQCYQEKYFDFRAASKLQRLDSAGGSVFEFTVRNEIRGYIYQIIH